MRSLVFALPFLVLTACSPPAQTNMPAPPPLSAEAQAAMDRINSADFSSIADEPAIPEPAIAPQPTSAPAPAPANAAQATNAAQAGPAGANQTEATVGANV